jgi:glycosyltransferase involved in cell wall biosynthesis
VNVLMLTHDFPPQILGGEGIFAGEIAARLSARGIGIEVVAPDIPGASEHDRLLPFPVHRVAVVRANFLTRTVSFAWSSRRIVRGYPGDVLYALRPVVRARQPVVSHFHVTRAGQARAAWRADRPLVALANALLAPLDSLHARRSAAVLATATTMRRELECLGISLRRFATVCNGVDTQRFNQSGRDGLRGERLLFVGRLDALKRIPDLLHAIASLAASFPEISLTIAGSGPEERRLLALGEQLGIGQRLRFAGQLPHESMPDLYRRHDVLVLPSAYESFGLTLLEAMACGTRALSSDACAALGQPTYRAGDAQALAQLLERVLREDPDGDPARSALEAAGLFGWDETATRVAAELAATLEDAGGETH